MAATGAKFRPGATDNLSLSAATTGTGTAIPMGDCREVSWFVTYSGTTSGGTVLIEWANTADYAGVWNQLDSITAANLSAGTEGAGFWPGPLPFVRARVSSDITGGGTISAIINGLLG